MVGTNDLAKDIGARYRPDREPLLTAISLCLLAGKAYGVPVYQLLGGKFRDRIRMYKHAGNDPAVITVGAVDTKGTAARGDDALAKAMKRVGSKAGGSTKPALSPVAMRP